MCYLGGNLMKKLIIDYVMMISMLYVYIIDSVYLKKIGYIIDCCRFVMVGVYLMSVWMLFLVYCRCCLYRLWKVLGIRIYDSVCGL